MATWDDVTTILASFPGTTLIGGDGTSDPVLRIQKRFFVRHRRADDAIAIQTGRDLREVLLGQGDPPFYSTPHYDTPRGGYVLVRLGAIDQERLREVLTEAWFVIAPKRLAETMGAGYLSDVPAHADPDHTTDGPASGNWARVQRIMAGFPETTEGASYGTPAFRIRKAFFVRLRDEGDNLVVKTGQHLRAALLAQGDPEFHTTPHYDGPDSGYVLIRLVAIGDDDLRDVLTDAWLVNAPPALASHLGSANDGS